VRIEELKSRIKIALPSAYPHQNDFRLGEQHFHFLALPPGLIIFIGFGQGTGDFTGAFVNAAGNFPRRRCSSSFLNAEDHT
jgi:hypothetical protein